MQVPTFLTAVKCLTGYLHENILNFDCNLLNPPGLSTFTAPCRGRFLLSSTLPSDAYLLPTTILLDPPAASNGLLSQVTSGVLPI